MVDSFELSPREADMLDAELATEAQSEQPAEQAETDPEPSGAEGRRHVARVRLDDELISQGICENRADALRTLMAGLVSSTERGRRKAPRGTRSFG